MTTDLIGRVADAGFKVVVANGAPSLVAIRRGATVPPDLLAELRANRDAVVAELSRETCRVCGRDVTDPELRELLVYAAHCDRGGAAKGSTDGNGVYHPPEERCPFKQSPWEGRS